MTAEIRDTFQVMDAVTHDLGLVACAVEATLEDPKTPPAARVRIEAARVDLHECMRHWALYARQMSVVLAKARSGDPRYKDAKGGDGN